MSAPDTGNWDSYATISKYSVSLTAGAHVLRLVCDGNGTIGATCNFDWFEAIPQSVSSPTPFKVNPANFGLIQAEDYDNGEQNVAYFDSDSINRGEQYRNNRVDIGLSPAEGGVFFVGWNESGEWLKYTVNVAFSGNYTLDFRVSSGVAGGSFHLEVDGKNVTGSINVPNTGSWDVYTTISRANVELTAGTHILRLAMDINGAGGVSGAVGNIDWFQATYKPSPPTGSSISGFIYGDANQNGARDTAELPLAGRDVFIDANNDGLFEDGEPIQTTLTDGSYQFADLSAGTYTLRTILAPGVIQTSKAGKATTVELSNLANFTGVNFGEVTLPGTIAGNVFNDANVNGIRDAGETGESAFRVYLDLNGNGIMNAGEPAALTDSSGNYTLSGLVLGAYTVRVVEPTGFHQTSPSGGAGRSVIVSPAQVSASVNFGMAGAGPASISGVVFNDQNANHIQDGNELGLGSVTVFIDVNHDGKLESGEAYTTTDSSGAYTIGGLVPGMCRVTEILPAGSWAVTSPPYTVVNVTVFSGQKASEINFGDVPQSTASISGRIYNDANKNGIYDAGDTPLVNWGAYVDLNDNGVPDPSEPGAHTGANGLYTIPSLPAGAYIVREIRQEPWQRTQPAGAWPLGYYSVSLGVGQAVVGRDFGNSLPAQFGAVAGTVFIDSNANGKLDAGEGGLPSRLVYLDLNGNNFLDNEEPAAYSDTSGHFLIPHIFPGNYTLHALLPPGSIQTTAGGGISATVVGGQAVSVNIGQSISTGSIGGTVYNDANDNGKRDAGESGLAGQIVYLDTNGDGVLQATEPSVTADSSGQYRFAGLAAGTYVIREVLPKDQAGAGKFYLTSSALTYQPQVNVVAGSTSTVSFGNRQSTGSPDDFDFNFTVSASVEQPDGKLVAVGFQGATASGNARSVIARYNPDGTLDATFGSGGEVVQTIGAHQSAASDVTLQSNGQIVVAGNFDINFGFDVQTQSFVVGTSQGYISRYNLDGTADASLQFRTNLPGFAQSGGIQGPAGYLLQLQHVFVLNDGRILALGQVARFDAAGRQPNTTFLTAYRFTAQGTPDSTFGPRGDGSLRTSFADSSNQVDTIPAFVGDGSFYVPQTVQAPGGLSEITLVSYDKSGNSTSLPYFSVTGHNTSAAAAAVQLDRMVVVAGSVDANSNGADFAISRIDTSANLLDKSFASGGQTTIDFGGIDSADDVQILADERILVSGHSTIGGNTAPVAVMFNPDGTVDKGFESGGLYKGPYTPTSSYQFRDLRYLLAHAGPAAGISPAAPTIGRGHPFFIAIPQLPSSSPVGQQLGHQKAHRFSEDTDAPTALLYYAPPVNVAAYGYYFFQVHYSDKRRIDLGSLGNQNLMITGPKGTTFASYYGTFGSTTAKDVYVFYTMFPPGGSWDSTDNGTYTISLQGGQVSNGSTYAALVVMGQFTVNAPPAVVFGSIYHDLNANGRIDPEDQSMAGWTVFIDLNNDGRLEAGETSAVTTGSGYSIQGLAPGTYTFRVVPKSGWQFSFPVGGGLTGVLGPVQALGPLNFTVFQ